MVTVALLILFASSSSVSATPTPNRPQRCPTHNDVDMLDPTTTTSVPDTPTQLEYATPTATPTPQSNAMLVPALTLLTAQSRSAASELLRSLADNFPGSINIYRQRAPCFYFKRDKKSLPPISERLTDDYVIASKFSSYFAQLRRGHEPFESYPRLVDTVASRVEEVRENLRALLVVVMDITPPTVESVEGSSTKCYATGYPNQARALMQLQDFLKNFLAGDISAVEHL